MNARRLLPGLMLLGVAACGDDGQPLQTVRPIISVCSTEEAEMELCDVPFELGRLPITLTATVTVFVVNRGEGVLELSAVGGDGTAQDDELPLRVPAGVAKALNLAIMPMDLGRQQATVVLASDDPERPSYELILGYEGIPKPVPEIELCVTGAGDEVCGTELRLDFGTVRRSQQASQTIRVTNVGSAPLAIEDVRIEGSASDPSELVLASSTRPGTLAVDQSAGVIVVYEPFDAQPDELVIVFVSDDPEVPEARVTVVGQSEENRPPVAIAREIVTSSTAIRAVVEDLVIIDGSASSDPEGDPLRFAWTLQTPARSAAQLDDPMAGRVGFVPDVAGRYRLELVVQDSLGQTSEVASVVLIEAVSRYALRVRLDWASGGDLDLHLVPEGESVFGPLDVYFENLAPDWGVAMDSSDDPELSLDAETPPGGEEVRLELAPAGRFEVYVHYFDDAGLSAASANVQVVFDDAATPAYSGQLSVSAECDLWFVGTVTMPERTFSPVGTSMNLCP